MEDVWSAPGGRTCIICKGARNLCGKDRCPILVKAYSRTKIEPLIDSLELDGSSPPGVFIGRYGYPKVMIGPLIPPVHGDTSMMDEPERWQGISIDDIVDFRSQLVRGKYAVDINDVENPNKEVSLTREIAMSKSSPDVEAEFKKKPVGRITLHSEVQPFGPSAPLADLDASSIKIDQKIDKAYSDTDLKAVEAVKYLYQKEIPISRIQKAFSVGAFGIGKNRRFVPTRWSITAVDDTLGKAMMEKTRTYPIINEYRVYEHYQLDNRWLVLMMPREWSYELIEVWYPNTLWNPTGLSVEMMSDAEGFRGRTKYAEIGGCYYSARMAVNELLNKEKRQATVVILREAHPGYIMPVGVWNVREAVREALKKNPLKFSNLGEVTRHVQGKMDIPLDIWIKNSAVLRKVIYQRRLSDYWN